jgi:hypothetical protein
MGCPPVSLGGLNDKLICKFPGVAVTPKGVLGGVAVVVVAIPHEVFGQIAGMALNPPAFSA